MRAPGHKITLLVCVVLFSTKNVRSQDYDHVKSGEACPNFTLLSSDGIKTLNSNNLKGAVTLINFFATWCGPCQRELPELEKKIWQKYKDRSDFNLVVIARGHGPKEVEKFKAARGYGFPMYPDSSRIVYDRFAVQYIPRNYIVNKEGVIVYSAINYTPEEFEKMLLKLEELLK